MARKKNLLPSVGEQMVRMRRAGVDGSQYLRPKPPPEGLDGLPDRIQALLDLLEKKDSRKLTDMLCFISYDIESNKVRTQVAKYLIRNGAIRVQKSVYFARLDPALYREMVTALREIQAMYDNADSIFFLPVSRDLVDAMQIVGRNLHMDIALKKPSTLII
jgi:CRISPR-associated protein Cas2